jgi:hypothetical protein
LFSTNSNGQRILLGFFSAASVLAMAQSAEAQPPKKDKLTKAQLEKKLGDLEAELAALKRKPQGVVGYERFFFLHYRSCRHIASALQSGSTQGYPAPSIFGCA